MNEEVMNRALTAAKSNLDNYKTATPEQLRARVAELEAQLETERMRLAACGVVALANTRKSAAKAREMLPEYRSASLEDVIRAVDSEMLLRDQLSDIARLRDVDAAQHQADEIEWNMQLAEAKRLCSIAVSDMQLEQKTANEVRAQLAETEALEIAHGERIEKLTKLLLLTKDALVKVLGWIDDCADTSPEYCFDPVEAQANEALAAINDSKAVEGLILCKVDVNYQMEEVTEDGKRTFTVYRAIEALALPHDDTALREWGARLLEKVAKENFEDLGEYSGHSKGIRFVAQQLRSGDWTP